MLTLSLIKNIQLQDFIQLFKELELPKWRERIKADTTNARYSSILRVMNEELGKTSDQLLTTQILDNFIYEHLFYTYKNYIYAYRFTDLIFTNTSTEEQVHDFFNSNPQLMFNKQVIINSDFSNFTLMSTRAEFNNGNLSNLNLLIKVDNVGTRRFPEVDVYAAVTIDLVSGLLLIRFNLSQLEKLNTGIPRLIELIKEMLTGQNRYGRALEGLNLTIVSLNEKEARKTIFKLFKELSVEAENIINSHVPRDADEKINRFLSSMGMHEITDDYTQQIKAVIYQDISSTLRHSDFENGWVYRFVFREGVTTRASTRTEDYSPIYSSKIYWHLKELVFKDEEMQEVGFHYIINGDDPDVNFLLVRLESRNDSIIINYYQKQRYNRREREGFVLRKIDRYLPRP